MKKQILTLPHQALRKKSRPVSNFLATEIKKTIKDLCDTLEATKEGLGLAAPQIGKNLRIFALELNGQIKIFINPTITHFSPKKNLLEEGCLSVPGKSGLVMRSHKVVLKYYDESGKKHKLTAKGLLAQAFQHELDHLNGELYVDKAEK